MTIQWLVAALFNSLWQDILIAAGVWFVLRVFIHTNAAVRHACWFVAVLAALIVPALTTHVSSVTVAHDGSLGFQWTFASSTARVAAVHSPGALPSSITVPALSAEIALLVWAIFAAFFLFRVLFDAFASVKLCRTAMPLELGLRGQLPKWRASGRGVRDVRLCVSPNAEVPMAVGVLDAMIVLPEDLLESLTPAEIDRVILHELAHLRRCDDWTEIVERVLAAVFFFNPAIQWMLRQLDVEREVSCDEAATQAENGNEYAASLVRMARNIRWPFRRLPAPGVFNARATLSVRVERLLLGRTLMTPGRIATALFGVAFALLLGASVSHEITPTIAYARPAYTSPSAPLNNLQEPTWVHARMDRMLAAIRAGTLTASEIGDTHPKEAAKSLWTISKMLRGLGTPTCERYLGGERDGTLTAYKYQACYTHGDAYLLMSVTRQHVIRSVTFSLAQ
jgi:beta-lactamase regulating signal transducer with metallopeptidase domain